MKDIILFCAGGFAGMAMIPIAQIIFEIMAFGEEDRKEAAALRDNEEVSILARGDEYYD